MGHSGNFRIMDASGITQSMLGSHYTEDGAPLVGVVFAVNTVDKLETYVTNQCVLLPSNWQSWSMQNLPPTGLLCVHTEDYGLGEADNVLAEAERLRGKVLAEMRGGGGVTVEVPPDSTPNTAPLPAPSTVEPVETVEERRLRLKRERKGR
jgi:hypothetical protein